MTPAQDATALADRLEAIPVQSFWHPEIGGDPAIMVNASLSAAERDLIVTSLRSTPSASAGTQTEAVVGEIRRLVIAARVVAFQDQGAAALRELDQASEAFADAVPWENGPAEHGRAVTTEATAYIKAVIENNAARCDDLLFDLDGEAFDKNNGSVLGLVAVCQQMKASLDALAAHPALAQPKGLVIQALRDALQEIADHPEKYNDGKRSYAVGWAFWNVQNIAKGALYAHPQQQQADGRANDLALKRRIRDMRVTLSGIFTLARMAPISLKTANAIADWAQKSLYRDGAPPFGHDGDAAQQADGRGAVLGAVERAMRENPYTTYSFAAQNDAVERKRAEKYVRMIARVVASALQQSPATDNAPAVGAHHSNTEAD